MNLLLAVTNQGKEKVEVKNAKTCSPKIEKDTDMIVKITTTAICGSDLHLYRGTMPLGKDYIIGHEPMGIVEEVGPAVKKVKKGDRVVIPFNVSCGECHFCKNHMESQCVNSNPHQDTGGYFGFSEMFGDYPGGQAEYLRVLMQIFHLLLFQKAVNLMMRAFCFYQMLFQPLIGVSKTVGLNLEIQLLY